MPLATRVLDAPITWTWLDGVASRASDVVKAVLPQPVKDVLHGTVLGHPLHPVLVQVPVGTWSSAVVLDVLATLTPGRASDGFDRASAVLVVTGLAGAVPAIAAGWADYADLHEEQRRIALVHAAANAVATSAFALSVLARGRGRTGRARALDLLGMSVAGGGAALGGHLSYRWAAGANHAEAVPHVTPRGWYPVARFADLTPGTPVGAKVGDTGVLVVRRGEDVFALADVCSHLAAPLHEGEVVEERGRTCIVCPWHQSVFALDDGSVVHGPASSPQPGFDTRVVDGEVHVRVRELPGVPAAEPVEGAVA
ncbi:Rieske 2Fe-2S domain-containing protein [Kineococcus sp. R8]|uniref:Rieske 2Fe-2S domain-containing protein n=1 Tax=Kineococcus siccus TaxID=2696567 RepID=UPI001412CDB3|nr:Rieske 2Fe-2S domain-containing protein [Kineococcus siccus]NAZ82089.1 Rieske 2Fe-2S domain-containing protein [Kineococcus siccus]